MKEYLHEICRSAASPVSARNKAREYLQALILSGMQKSGAMTSCAFHGGTALRFLFALPRFSEDLDFTLESERMHFDFTVSIRPSTPPKSLVRPTAGRLGLQNWSSSFAAEGLLICGKDIQRYFG